jgi:hypothetical protein
LVVGLLAVSGWGREVPVPSGDVVLTVSGAIALSNNGDLFEFDMDMLKALPYLAYQVEDPWMGTQAYGGVTLKAILDYVGIPAGASTVTMICSDEKEFSVAARDALYYPILLVYTLDGDDLPASLGGPIKLAYPYDTYPEIQNLYDENNWAWYVVGVRVDY